MDKRPGRPASTLDVTGRPHVIDGDTLSLNGQKIRLTGIDAPERDQTCQTPSGAAWACGQQATQALSERIGWSSIRCDVRGHDRYGRAIGTCFQGEQDLNRWMVANGWAVAYRQYSTDYVADEARARRTRAGMWSGTFTMPSEWRKARREASAADSRVYR
ncbi:MAG: thermonuclease family protein [Proteobacteria bacterium]|nr:thermonuclease family protein [Pseudomonadota bacterium]